ncbi:nucleoside triphosphate hydrolase [Ciceribacter azotifigens]|uniref:nucleoside triphosphate hydrolase n=1 Tax=Ciceribacter azotifigens TaxID=2069303 RepID=UPI003A87826F
MTPSLADVADEVKKRAAGHARFVVAIAGPPGAGKSTIAETLAETLAEGGETAVVLPMDGFHMDNAVLEEKGLLQRKGAPETFDVRGFIDIVRAIRAGGEVLVPVFDRSREIAIAAARVISPAHRIVVAEGNYLLLDEAPWRGLAGLFDLSIFLDVPEDVLAKRLADRWSGYGLTPTEIAAKVGENDLPNGRRVLRRSRPADLVIANV